MAAPETADAPADPPRRRLRWGGTRDRVVWSALVSFLLVRLLEVGLGPPSTYNDSKTYRAGFLDFSKTSLDGHSVRPWGATIWLALFPSDRTLVFGQVLLSVVAWSVLALTIAGAIERPAVRRGAVVAVLVLACTAQVAGWDLAVLSESVSISSGILTLAAGIAFARRPDWVRGCAFLAAALWFAMTRPNIIPLLLAWVVVLVLVAVLQRRFLPGLVVVGVLVVLSLYSYVYNVRTDAAWQELDGVSRTTVAYAYPISRNDPVAAAVIRDLHTSDVPQCMVPAAAKDVGPFGPTEWVVRTAKACPGGDAWLTSHWNVWWVKWLAAHPRQAATIIGVTMPGALTTPVWTSVTAAVPNSVSTLYFPAGAIPQAAVVSRTYWSQPLLLWAAVALALALLARRRWRGSGWAVDLFLVATAAGTLVSVAGSVLIIQTSAIEMGRESAGLVVVLTASCVALVGCGLDRLTRARPDLEASADDVDEASDEAPGQPDYDVGAALS